MGQCGRGSQVPTDVPTAPPLIQPTQLKLVPPHPPIGSFISFSYFLVASLTTLPDLGARLVPLSNRRRGGLTDDLVVYLSPNRLPLLSDFKPQKRRSIVGSLRHIDKAADNIVC